MKNAADPQQGVVDHLVTFRMHRHGFRHDLFNLVSHDAELTAVAPSITMLGLVVEQVEANAERIVPILAISCLVDLSDYYFAFMFCPPSPFCEPVLCVNLFTSPKITKTGVLYFDLAAAAVERFAIFSISVIGHLFCMLWVKRDRKVHRFCA